MSIGAAKPAVSAKREGQVPPEADVATDAMASTLAALLAAALERRLLAAGSVSEGGWPAGSSALRPHGGVPASE
ncbi:hypothetical protein [Siccirubricoccus sp. G192]|uniref:hypothetical protein n=1 Tax=Siccirubricoccus sp. G192 TaxID=2849651 RepID=UPI001C2C2244|nr:hypothetical protein [Siccirubricoccus sp. G192]MBV1796605.1 hypothetical protein [Siccirubricoccus sp. G192]